jgi:hypothetical protein
MLFSVLSVSRSSSTGKWPVSPCTQPRANRPCYQNPLTLGLCPVGLPATSFGAVGACTRARHTTHHAAARSRVSLSASFLTSPAHTRWIASSSTKPRRDLTAVCLTNDVRHSRSRAARNKLRNLQRIHPEQSGPIKNSSDVRTQAFTTRASFRQGPRSIRADRWSAASGSDPLRITNVSNQKLAHR